MPERSGRGYFSQKEIWLRGAKKRSWGSRRGIGGGLGGIGRGKEVANTPERECIGLPPCMFVWY